MRKVRRNTPLLSDQLPVFKKRNLRGVAAYTPELHGHLVLVRAFEDPSGRGMGPKSHSQKAAEPRLHPARPPESLLAAPAHWPLAGALWDQSPGCCAQQADCCGGPTGMCHSHPPPSQSLGLCACITRAIYRARVLPGSKRPPPTCPPAHLPSHKHCALGRMPSQMITHSPRLHVE